MLFHPKKNKENDMEQTFTQRAYAKHELALRYFPHSRTKRAAVAHFMEMIHQTRDLYPALLAQGYNKYAKWFTPKEVQLITHYLGEP